MRLLAAFVLCLLALPARGETTSPEALPTPLYGAYDFFVVAGQSNAKGRGDAPLAPAVPLGAAYEVTINGDVVPLADPVGGANTGSAWPAFVNAYTAATGRGVVIVGLATNGSRQVAIVGDGANQHWDVSTEDNLYTRTDRRARRALEEAENQLPGVRLAGWLWVQGGTDGRRIDDGQITAVQYETALHALARRINFDWGVPMYLMVSGTDARGDTPGFQAVRAVQNEADALEEVVVIYRDAYLFPERGWMQPDNVHWSQPGLNEAGTFGAAIAAADRLARLAVFSADPTSRDYTQDVIVYPNPASGAPWVNAGCPFTFTVADALGRRLARGSGSGPTLLPDLLPGAYVLTVRPRAGSAAECSGRVLFTVVR